MKINTNCSHLKFVIKIKYQNVNALLHFNKEINNNTPEKNPTIF